MKKPRVENLVTLSLQKTALRDRIFEDGNCPKRPKFVEPDCKIFCRSGVDALWNIILCRVVTNPPLI
jgi:hypothetical protein